MEWIYLFYNVTVEVFYKVGVFVSISLLLISLIDYKFNGIIIKLLEKDKKNQVYFSALLGLIPGCGPQILLAAIYISGGIPFSALVANAICNDGDALFPLLALSKKSALLVTLYNVIPALLVGGFLYLLET